MEMLRRCPGDPIKPKAVLFDFDGTLSTLRQGWEEIMEPMMLEMISGAMPAEVELVQAVREYISQSAGIQTIYQMQWLAGTVKQYGRNPGLPDCPRWYKAEYNRRLMQPVKERIRVVTSGEKPAEDYLIKGSRELLAALRQQGVEMYVASGTDHADVVNEAETLGIAGFFTRIAGAPEDGTDCSKEAVLRGLLEEKSLQGPEVAVVGDGKVEIALGRTFGARTLGVASDEMQRCGVNPVKRERLIKAGAHAITGDFDPPELILAWLGW